MRFNWTKIKRYLKLAYDWAFDYFIIQVHFGCSLVDDFNSYNDGNLDTQGDWSGANNFDVQGVTVQEGDKAISALSDGTNRTIIKSFTGEADGKQVGYMRVDSTSGKGGFAITSNVGWEGNFYFWDGHICLYGSGAYNIILDVFNSNTWYKLEWEWRVSDHSWRGRVDDGDWSDWYTTASNTWTTITATQLVTANVPGYTLYFDSLFDPTPTQKSVSDSGLGVETVGIKGVVPVVETGAGVDIITAITGKIPIIDQGSGAEILAIKNSLSVEDLGVGIDIISAIEAKLSILESGSGVDIIQKSDQILIQDLGVGEETFLDVKLVKAIQDLGAGADIITAIKAKLLITDSGLGAGVISVLSKVSIQDSGIGQDLAKVLGIVNITDQGIGSDLVKLIVAKLLVQDSGIGADQVIMVMLELVQDSGAGSDLISILTKVLIQDLGAGTDRVKVPPFFQNKFSKQENVYANKFSKQKTKHQDKYFY